MPDRKFLAFLAVGALNTAFGYAVFAVLVFVGLPHAWALLVSTCAGVAFNFWSTGFLVFANRTMAPLPRFLLVYGAMYLVNVLFLELAILAGLNAYVGGAVSMAATAIISYTTLRRFVFQARP